MDKQTASLEHSLATAPIGRLILRFAVPSVVAMLVNAMYNLVDQLFISHSVGYLGNGATNVVLLLHMIPLSAAMLLGDGAAAFYSLRLGEGKREEAAQGAGCALLTLGILSLGITALCFVFLTPLLRLFGCTPVLLPYARDYGELIVPGLPLLLMSTGMNAVIRAHGSPRYAMGSMIAGAVLNALLDPVFLFGFHWGMRGAALSTLLGQLLTFLLCAFYFRRRGRALRLRVPRQAFPGMLTAICGLGVSSSIDQLSFSLVMAVHNNVIIRVGVQSAYGSEIPLTSYGISMKLQEILFTLVLGVAIGMQPIVGFNFGAGKRERALRAYALAVALSTGICCLGAVAFFAFPEALARLFGTGETPLFLTFTKQFLRTYFLLIPLLGFQTVTGVFFQAIGRPRQAAGLSLSYQLVFKILSVLALSSVFGLSGVLWSGPTADLLAFILALTLLLCQRKQLRAVHPLPSP